MGSDQAGLSQCDSAAQGGKGKGVWGDTHDKLGGAHVPKRIDGVEVRRRRSGPAHVPARIVVRAEPLPKVPAGGVAGVEERSADGQPPQP